MNKPVEYHYGKFPPENINWEGLVPFIGRANAALARYDGTLSAIPNANVLLSPLSTQEAVLSSKIEGTQATMGEVLEYEAEEGLKDAKPERAADIQEVLNYRRAMWQAINLLETLPLCQRLIKETHCKLMEGVRGYNKCPGEYRNIQNWIGPPGCTMEEARFVPISADRLNQGMDVWEKYIHKEILDPLVQLAVVHAEFEALHPFLDGNGRLGRMCVPLFMFRRGLIQSPMFYISAYFEAHRDEYYDRLLAISQNDDWNGWCAFFLKAVEKQAKNNQKKAKDILDLYEQKKNQIPKLTKSQFGIHALDFIFKFPIFVGPSFTNTQRISLPTAKRILNLLKSSGIIKQVREPSGRSPALYTFTELLNIAEGSDVF